MRFERKEITTQWWQIKNKMQTEQIVLNVLYL